MRRAGTIAALSLVVLALTASSALAANPHFVQKVAPPECSITGTTVTCSSTEIAGVGNTNAVATLDVTATGIVDCNNPGNNPNNPIESHETTFNFSTTSDVLEPKNGRLTVPALTATAPTSLTPEQEAELCPNPNWEADLREGSVVITSYSYDITFVGETEPFFETSGP